MGVNIFTFYMSYLYNNIKHWNVFTTVRPEFTEHRVYRTVPVQGQDENFKGTEREESGWVFGRPKFKEKYKPSKGTKQTPRCQI